MKIEPIARPRRYIVTTKVANSWFVVWNSIATCSIAGENIAEARSLTSVSISYNFETFSWNTDVIRVNKAMVEMMPAFLQFDQFIGFAGSLGPSQEVMSKVGFATRCLSGTGEPKSALGLSRTSTLPVQSDSLDKLISEFSH